MWLLLPGGADTSTIRLTLLEPCRVQVVRLREDKLPRPVAPGGPMSRGYRIPKKRIRGSPSSVDLSWPAKDVRIVSGQAEPGPSVGVENRPGAEQDGLEGYLTT